MATAYTSLLGLALPVTGELSGSWGDVVNDSITSLLDSAISGTTSITTDADITLTTTTGAANQARQAIILWNPASGTTTRNITAPAQSKIYTVINASGGTQSIVFRGAGPTTGVTIVKGESAVVAWNGTDFIKISNAGGSASFTNVTVSGTTTLSGLTASTALALNASKEVVSVTNTGTGNNVLSASPTLTGTISGANASLSGTLGVTGVATLTAQPILSSLTTSQAVFTDGSKGLVSNAITGTGNVVMSASPTLTGTITAAAANFSGAVALGDAAADNITVNGTVTSNLIFTDNTYDIGASGATRPRNLFLAGNATVGGDIVLTGSLDLTNLEVTNIKAKDGTAGMQIADSTGVVSFTANPVMSGGTANGVSFLNASKVLTTGSALTFDGTSLKATGKIRANNAGVPTADVGFVTLNGYQGTSSANGGFAIVPTTGGGAEFYTHTGAVGSESYAEQMRLTSTGLGIGTSSPSQKLDVNGNISLSGAGTGARYVALLNETSTYAGTLTLQAGGGSSGFGGGVSMYGHSHATYPGAVWIGYSSGTSTGIIFGSGGNGVDSEAMRLTSTGLGIGTSSPTEKLDIVGRMSIATSTSPTAQGQYGYNLLGGTYIWPKAGSVSDFILYRSDGNPGLQMTSPGNLGLGGPPKPYLNPNYNALDMHSGRTVLMSSSGTPQTNLQTNAYYDTSFQYSQTGFAASNYVQQSGEHRWLTAPSGTAGDAISFTQALTLTANGSQLLGTTVEPTNRKSGNTYQAINSAVIEGTPYTTVSTSPVQLSRSSGVGLIAMVSGFNTSGGSQGTWLVLVASGSATVVSSSDATATVPTFSVSAGALRMQTTTGTLSVVCQIFSGA